MNKSPNKPWWMTLTRAEKREAIAICDDAQRKLEAVMRECDKALGRKQTILGGEDA